MFSVKRFDMGDYAKQMKRAMILTLALSPFSIHQATAESNDIQTIYHVYNNEEIAGKISEEDKAELDKVLSEKLQEAKHKFPEYEFQIDKDVSFIPEQVFEAPNLDATTVEKFKNEIQVEASAQALVIDGKEIAYVSSKEEAEKLLHTFKLQHVTQEELNQFEQGEDTSAEPLTAPGVRVHNIEFSKEVEVEKSSVDPNEILNTQQALTLLNNGTTEMEKYTVKEGDSLEKIASAHQLTTTELLSLNLAVKANTVLKIGQELNVTIAKPLLEVTIDKEVFKNQVVPYERKVEESDSLPKGETKIKQEGKNGQKSTHYVVKQTNGKQVSQNVISETVTTKPVAEVRLKGTKDLSKGSGQFTWPTVGGYVSSKTGYRWGRMHKGIDIARPNDLTIKAADNGVVASAGYSGGYGNKIVIDHQNGMRTIYAHLSSIAVKPGQTVGAGSKIGVMGTTGNSTGVHLHFELYINGELVNPLDYL